MGVIEQEKLAIYFIAGTQDLSPNQNLPELLEEAILAGVTAFQYREKGQGSLQDETERLDMARQLQKICQKHGVLFFINDDVALALTIQADGIHIGQEDQDIMEVIQQTAGRLLIGLSCHNLSEISQGNRLNEVSYLGIGPVFTTTSKLDALPALGIQGFKELASQGKKPVVAIGGLTVRNSQELPKDLLAGIAVISAITQSENLQETIAQLNGS